MRYHIRYRIIILYAILYTLSKKTCDISKKTCDIACNIACDIDPVPLVDRCDKNKKTCDIACDIAKLCDISCDIP